MKTYVKRVEVDHFSGFVALSIKRKLRLSWYIWIFWTQIDMTVKHFFGLNFVSNEYINKLELEWKLKTEPIVIPPRS